MLEPCDTFPPTSPKDCEEGSYLSGHCPRSCCEVNNCGSTMAGELAREREEAKKAPVVQAAPPAVQAAPPVVQAAPPVVQAAAKGATGSNPLQTGTEPEVIEINEKIETIKIPAVEIPARVITVDRKSGDLIIAAAGGEACDNCASKNNIDESCGTFPPTSPKDCEEGSYLTKHCARSCCEVNNCGSKWIRDQLPDETTYYHTDTQVDLKKPTGFVEEEEEVPETGGPVFSEDP